MALPNFCVKRPVTTIMIMLFVALFGLISLLRLPQELFPPITYPQLTVVTVYANAAPEEIETLITKVIEEAVGTVSGLRRVKSVSKEGMSLVIAEFGWNENMDFAALKVREKIDLIKERLPRESGEPLVMKYNPFERPVLTLSVTGRRSPVQIREIARRIIKDELEKVEGVASATISGGLEREIAVEIDQARLYSNEVPIMDVVNAITNSNLNYPAGTIKESFYEYLVRTLGEFEHVDEIKNIPVKTYKEDEMQMRQRDAYKREQLQAVNMVFLRDVADVYDTFKERTSYSRYNGEGNVSVSIQKQAQTNTLQVVNRVRKKLEFIQEELPKDMKVRVIDDQSTFIRDSINGVRDAAVQGGILAFLVLFFFLRNVKSSLIVTASMPISIMAVFVAMYFFGISLNMMSLGGLALGVGMLVDNAIVVLENITRHKDMGVAPREAAIAGTNEVANAISASTLTTIAVFLPMIFVVGMAGQLFKQLAFTVIFALIASLAVALMLIPLLTSMVKKTSMEVSPELTKKTEYYLGRFEKFLRAFLTNPRIGALVIAGLFLVSLIFYVVLDKELMPKMDQGQFTVKVNMPAGTKLDVTNQTVFRIENFIRKLGVVETVHAVVGSTRGKGAEDVLQRLGSHQGEITVLLRQKRKDKTKDVVKVVEETLQKVNLPRTQIEYILNESVFSGAIDQSSPIIVEIKGKEIPEMLDIVGKVKAIMVSVKGIYGVKTDMPERSPETRIVVDKDKAALNQLSVVDIAQTTQVALRGYIASEFKEKGHEIDIRVRLREKDRDNFNKLAQVHLTSPFGQSIPLTSLVEFSKGRGPSEIRRLDQERTIIVSANIFRRPLKDIVRDIEKKIAGLSIAEDYTVRLAGESEEMKQSFNSLRGALILSIILVYMIMAAQFESLWQPLIIMFTFPLSLVGVIFALAITGTSINVIVMLGIIMLGGIVVNNGIVLIDYVNILRKKGMPVVDSVIEASKARLRPILMTAMTTVLGLFPMALALGEGAELRSPLAISVMGGLFVTTFLSLLVIPAIYLATHNVRVKMFKR